MSDTTKHTTANEPVSAIDPGGTRPTKAGHDKPGQPAPAPEKQTVVSGDQNQPADKRAR